MPENLDPGLRSTNDDLLEKAQRLYCPHCKSNIQLLCIIGAGIPRVFVCGGCGAMVCTERCKTLAGDVVRIQNPQRQAVVAFDNICDWWKLERPSFIEQIERNEAAAASAEGATLVTSNVSTTDN